jgi:hypothetical protein
MKATTITTVTVATEALTIVATMVVATDTAIDMAATADS